MSLFFFLITDLWVKKKKEKRKEKKQNKKKHFVQTHSPFSKSLHTNPTETSLPRPKIIAPAHSIY